MSYYAVIDTNVLISALLTKNVDSATVKVLYAVARGDIIPLYNFDIFEEYNEVLHRSKFPFSESRIQNVLEMIKQFGIIVDASHIDEQFIDPDDLVFYEVTMEKREDSAYLITGNLKHFPRREFIVTPVEMIDIISNNSHP